MQPGSLLALSVLVASTSAATCWGDVQTDIANWSQAFWDARAKMCSNSACGLQQPCTVKGSKKVGDKTLSLQLVRRNWANTQGYKDCWDATNDIINQCIYGQHLRNGYWEWEGQYFEIQSWFEE
ncbi:hypothetical protein BGZ63DRAFT_358733 [Mariannaea sp. PMI_226]|nr:hypothetical protein BGZ63DRAFT_358733 [Mariannaea sp. PMI_226]